MLNHTPLSLLAEFGPLTRECIATALDVPWVDVGEHVVKLQRQGLVVEAGPLRWDVTEAGRARAETFAAMRAEAFKSVATAKPKSWLPGRRAR